jgi:hypothetical protein
MPVNDAARRPTQRPLRIALAIALGWSPAARAQSAAPPQESCIKVYLNADGQGKGLLSLAGRAVSPRTSLSPIGYSRVAPTSTSGNR